MSEEPRQTAGGDDLLEKLDRLLHKHRPVSEPVPTLQEAGPQEDNIPVLTDAVSGPTVGASPSNDPHETVETRLIAAVSREVSRLRGELPEHAEQLRMLGNTLFTAIRMFTRRHLDPEPPENEK